MASVLAGVPCSVLSTSVRDRALQVQGYLPKSFGIAQLKDSLSRVLGVNSLNVDVQQVSDEKCGAIKAFAPYWASNRQLETRQPGAVASIRTKQANSELTEGDFLILDIKTPGYDSYVYVDYYSFDVNVVHLVPGPRVKGNQAPAKSGRHPSQAD